jgi:hypothetical protein
MADDLLEEMMDAEEGPIEKAHGYYSIDLLKNCWEIALKNWRHLQIQ